LCKAAGRKDTAKAVNADGMPASMVPILVIHLYDRTNR
jgi:hypothetical protein